MIAFMTFFFYISFLFVERFSQIRVFLGACVSRKRAVMEERD